VTSNLGEAEGRKRRWLWVGSQGTQSGFDRGILNQRGHYRYDHSGYEARIQETEEVKIRPVWKDVSITPRLLLFPGRTNPTAAFALLLGIVLYQLFMGRLLNLKWGVWVTRKERPGIYWTVLVIEATVSILGIYIGTLK